MTKARNPHYQEGFDMAVRHFNNESPFRKDWEDKYHERKANPDGPLDAMSVAYCKGYVDGWESCIVPMTTEERSAYNLVLDLAMRYELAHVDRDAIAELLS